MPASPGRTCWATTLDRRRERRGGGTRECIGGYLRWLSIPACAGCTPQVPLAHSTGDKLLAPQAATSKCPSPLGPRGSPANQRSPLRLVGAKHATPAFYRDNPPSYHRLYLIIMSIPLLVSRWYGACTFLPHPDLSSLLLHSSPDVSIPLSAYTSHVR